MIGDQTLSIGPVAASFRPKLPHTIWKGRPATGLPPLFAKVEMMPHSAGSAGGSADHPGFCGTGPDARALAA